MIGATKLEVAVSLLKAWKTQPTNICVYFAKEFIMTHVDTSSSALPQGRISCFCACSSPSFCISLMIAEKLSHRLPNAR